jgi:ABC-type dipeptide/oligopeptide/nickel transport system permease subunit
VKSDVLRRSLALAVVISLGVILLGAQFIELNTEVKAILQKPSVNHWWGTDSLGRDLLLRTLQGYGFSFLLALFATALSALIGISLGAWAGWMGGRTDLVLMRGIEILESIPDLLLTIVLVLVLVVIFGQADTAFGFLSLSVALGLSSWFEIARQTRVLTLRERQMLYAESAVALGASRSRILFRHIWPNIQSSIWVLLLLQIPGFILFEASLSFFGFGVQPPAPSLGQVFVEGWRVMAATSHVIWGPTFLLFATLLGFRSYSWLR